MEDLNIYIVLNVDKFKKLCKKKLGNNINTVDFIILDCLENERVHLVPKYSAFIEKNYIHSIPQDRSDFDIYIRLKDRWIKKTFVSIKHTDIKQLISDGAITSLENII